MTLQDKIEAIRKKDTVYEIVFRNAGVGFSFKDDYLSSIRIHQYYPTLELAADGEMARLHIPQNTKRTDPLDTLASLYPDLDVETIHLRLKQMYTTLDWDAKIIRKAKEILPNESIDKIQDMMREIRDMK